VDQKLLIDQNSSIMDAMRQLEENERRILFVVDPENHLLGTVTDGDIRRWILAEGSLDSRVGKVCNTHPYVVKPGYDLAQVKEEMLLRKITSVPVVNAENQVIDFLMWESIYGENISYKPTGRIDLPVVIMAGGKGTRLDPFTKVLPKPLVPVGEKTVIEIIIDSFVMYGVDKFYISVNYKSKIIKSYFEELNPTYGIEYVHEDIPLGTAGSLRFLRGKINSTFIVTNCDIILKADYLDIVQYHLNNHNDITLVASLKNYNIPYGVCEIENGGVLKCMREKPEYNFLVNIGMYILEKDTVEHIPDNEFFHITHLIEKVQESGGKVGVYPIGDKAWIDVGEWSEYKKALSNINHFLT
jgi:dTDP-glucose pyrophosphorylase